MSNGICRNRRAPLFRWLSLCLALLCKAAFGQQEIVLAQDGSITGVFGCKEKGQVTLRFGLPSTRPEKTQRDGPVLRLVWLSEGIRYTETVVLASPGAEAGWVLLVNLEGENTNPEYTEASAALAVQFRGKAQPLELRSGMVRIGAAEQACTLGALEIPEAGIKLARGETLQFRGSIPPSLKGSMTLKLPLTPVADQSAADALADVEFESELRRALSSGVKPSSPARIRLKSESGAKRDVAGKRDGG